MSGFFDSHYRKEHIFTIKCIQPELDEKLKLLDEKLEDGYMVKKSIKIHIDNIDVLIFILRDPDY